MFKMIMTKFAYYVMFVKMKGAYDMAFLGCHENPDELIVAIYFDNICLSFGSLNIKSKIEMIVKFNELVSTSFI